MPVFRLTENIIFPHPHLANKDGILAVGGDLSPERLLLAYENGIFPWYQGDPIIWWSPDPRFVLFPEDIRISKSMKKLIKKETYNITFDKSFREVIHMCGKLREGNTWLDVEMLEAYCVLHEKGYAHSVETWFHDQLVGGLYGISMGKCFFGESMFSTMANSSKLALVTLCEKLLKKNFTMIDCQVYSEHLESMGAIEISRATFLNLLKNGLQYDTLLGNWGSLF